MSRSRLGSLGVALPLSTLANLLDQILCVAVLGIEVQGKLALTPRRLDAIKGQVDARQPDVARRPVAISERGLELRRGLPMLAFEFVYLAQSKMNLRVLREQRERLGQLALGFDQTPFGEELLSACQVDLAV